MSGNMLRAEDIHGRVDWPVILASLGVPESFLRLKKAGPCLFCGGTDRWVFDNRRGRGDYFCRRCGPGSGFDLLMKFAGQDFASVRKRVLQAGGLAERGRETPVIRRQVSPDATGPARPTRRVHDLWRTSCRVEDCQDAVDYLGSRGLWPLPPGCALRAHVGVDYYAGGQRVGRYAALVAPVCDVDGEFVTLHVTHLQQGRKLTGHEPRKLLSPVTGREGCAVRLMPARPGALGVAEGVETALSAAAIHGMPTWAALNTSLLTRFEPPSQTARLVVYADNDEPGIQAATRLVDRLKGRVETEIVVPPPGLKDWNDTIVGKASK